MAMCCEVDGGSCAGTGVVGSDEQPAAIAAATMKAQREAFKVNAKREGFGMIRPESRRALQPRRSVARRL